MTSDSLRELEDLAETDDIPQPVHQLWLIPSVFDGFNATSEHAIAELADNSSLLASETFITRLHSCLEKFENLDTVGLAHYTTSFLLDSRQKRVRFLGRRLIKLTSY